MREKLKSFLADDLSFYGSLIVLVAIISFGLGRASNGQFHTKIEPNIDIISQLQPIPRDDTDPVPASGSVLKPTPVNVLGSEEKVVASRSGTRYHLPTCPGAKQIKPENLITFPNPAAAVAAGYTKAANCPGL